MNDWSWRTWVEPHGPWRLVPAIEIAVAMLVSVGGLMMFGLASTALTSSLGTFCALYFAHRPRRVRTALLPKVALGLITASVLGMLSWHSPLLTSCALVTVAAGSTWLSNSLETGPPGPLMFVLTCGVSNYAAAHALSSDAVSLWMIPVAVAFGSTIAWIVVFAPLTLEPGTARSATGDVAPFRGPQWHSGMQLTTLSARMAWAVASSCLIGHALGLHRSYWVAMTAVAVLLRGSHWEATVRRAVFRIVGTVGGLAAYVLLSMLHPHALGLAVMIATLQFCTELVVAAHYGIALVFITPTALLIAEAASGHQAPGIAQLRLLDTAVGATTALASTWLLDLILKSSRHAGRKQGPGA